VRVRVPSRDDELRRARIEDAVPDPLLHVREPLDDRAPRDVPRLLDSELGAGLIHGRLRAVG
jgi:hypothetical protein